tara:strand:- start:329 stop:1237 length:909 start_codon:yes stop_codon:yes gene_type:complete
MRKLAHLSKATGLSLAVCFMLLTLSACSTNMGKITFGNVKDASAQHSEGKMAPKPEEKAELDLYKEERSRLIDLGKKILVVNGDLCKKRSEAFGFEACGYGLTLDTESDRIHSYADGEAIYVTNELVSTVEDDALLAWVISYQLARNVMRQPQQYLRNSQLAQVKGFVVDLIMFGSGVDTRGEFSKQMSSASSIIYGENLIKEADYIALYFIARAGFDPQVAKGYWTKQGLGDEQKLYPHDLLNSNGTHPYWESELRLRAIESTIAEIRALQDSGKPLIPDLPARRVFRSDLDVELFDVDSE